MSARPSPAEPPVDDVARLIQVLLYRRSVPLTEIKTLFEEVRHLKPFRRSSARGRDSDVRRALATALDQWLPWDADDLEALGLPAQGAEREIWHQLLLGNPLEGPRSFLPVVRAEWSERQRDLKWDLKAINARLADESRLIATALLSQQRAHAPTASRILPVERAADIPNSAVEHLLVIPPTRIREIDGSEVGLGTWAFDGRVAPYVSRNLDEELVLALENSDCPVTVVIGPPKAGKSRFLLEGLRTAAPDKLVWWVNTAPHVLGELAQLLENYTDERARDSEGAQFPDLVVVLDDLQRCGTNPVNGVSTAVLARLAARAVVVATLHDDKLAAWETQTVDRTSGDYGLLGASRELLIQLRRGAIHLAPELEEDREAEVWDMLIRSQHLATSRTLDIASDRIWRRLAELLAAVDQLSTQARQAMTEGGYRGALISAAIDAGYLHPGGFTVQSLESLTRWHWLGNEPTFQWKNQGFSEALLWAQKPVGGRGSPHAVLQPTDRDRTRWRLMDAVSSRLSPDVWTPHHLVGSDLPARELVGVARLLYDGGQINQATVLCEALAAAGSTDAMGELMHRAVLADTDDWPDLFERALEAGDGYALTFAGLHDLATGNADRARSYLQRAQQSGYRFADHNLSFTQDLSRAIAPLEKLRKQFQRGLITHFEFIDEAVHTLLHEPDGSHRRPASFCGMLLAAVARQPDFPSHLLAEIVSRAPGVAAREDITDVLARELLIHPPRHTSEGGDFDLLEEILVQVESQQPLSKHWEQALAGAPVDTPLTGAAIRIYRRRGDRAHVIRVVADSLATGCSYAFQRSVRDEAFYEWRTTHDLFERTLDSTALGPAIRRRRWAALTSVATIAATIGRHDVVEAVSEAVPIGTGGMDR